MGRIFWSNSLHGIQNKTKLSLTFYQVNIYLFILFITNKKINSLLSTNKYEIGKDLAPQNKNTSHMKTKTISIFGQFF